MNNTYLYDHYHHNHNNKQNNGIPMVYLWYTYIISLMCFNGFYEARGAVDSRDAQRMTPLHLCVSALSEDAQLEAKMLLALFPWRGSGLTY